MSGIDDLAASVAAMSRWVSFHTRDAAAQLEGVVGADVSEAERVETARTLLANASMRLGGHADTESWHDASTLTARYLEAQQCLDYTIDAAGDDLPELPINTSTLAVDDLPDNVAGRMVAALVERRDAAEAQLRDVLLTRCSMGVAVEQVGAAI